MVNVGSPGAASSSHATPPSAQPGITSGAGKGTLAEPCNEDEAPDKAQKILSICVGQGASDKEGEVTAEIYENDLTMTRMAEEYESRNAAGECFVDIRKQHSSNKDLRALSRLPKRQQILQGGFGKP